MFYYNQKTLKVAGIDVSLNNITVYQNYYRKQFGI